NHHGPGGTACPRGLPHARRGNKPIKPDQPAPLPLAASGAWGRKSTTEPTSASTTASRPTGADPSCGADGPHASSASTWPTCASNFSTPTRWTKTPRRWSTPPGKCSTPPCPGTLPATTRRNQNRKPNPPSSGTSSTARLKVDLHHQKGPPRAQHPPTPDPA